MRNSPRAGVPHIFNSLAGEATNITEFLNTQINLEAQALADLGTT
jgi:hypothetical protein